MDISVITEIANEHIGHGPGWCPEPQVIIAQHSAMWSLDEDDQLQFLREARRLLEWYALYWPVAALCSGNVMTPGGFVPILSNGTKWRHVPDDYTDALRKVDVDSLPSDLQGPARSLQVDFSNWEREQSAASRPDGRRAKKHVYFIRAIGQELIKIGHSVDPYGRFTCLRTMSPSPLELIGVSSTGTESEWHRRWSHIRVNGEWFQETSELLAEIRESLAQHG